MWKCNFYSRNDRYNHFAKYWPSLLNHPMIEDTLKIAQYLLLGHRYAASPGPGVLFNKSSPFFPTILTLVLCRRRKHVPPKCWYSPIKIDEIRSKKTVCGLEQFFGWWKTSLHNAQQNMRWRAVSKLELGRWRFRPKYWVNCSIHAEWREEAVKNLSQDNR